MVGDIVWVKDNVSGIYWPGEALDPFNMPLGRSIPTEALSKLSSEQLRDSIPSLDGTWKPNKKSDARRLFVMYFPLDYAKWQVRLYLLSLKASRILTFSDLNSILIYLYSGIILMRRCHGKSIG